MGTGPASELQIALLGIGVAQAVHFRKSGIGRVPLVDPQVVDILSVVGNHAPPASELLGLFQQISLLLGSDGHGTPPAPLGPAGPEQQVIAPVRPAGMDLEGFLPPQAEGLLQSQAHAHILVPDQGELFSIEISGLALLGRELPVRDPVEVIGAGDHASMVNFLRPPAQNQGCALFRLV